MGTNPFLIYGRISRPKPPRRLYALLDQADIMNDGRYRLLFDSIDAQWFDERGAEIFSRLPPMTTVLDYYQGSPVYVLQWDIQPLAPPPAIRPLDLAIRAPGEDDGWLDLLERQWIELLIEPVAAPESQLFYNLFAEPIPVAVRNARRLTASDPLTALSQSDPLAPIPDATVSAIENEIRSALGGRNVDYVGVYDIGQGSCAGLSSAGKTVIYADFGGGVLGNTHTFPAALKHFCFCAGRSPPVILSHWDWDHWSSANRDTRALGLTWIAPRQHPLGPVHGTFIAGVIGAGGRFLIWPSGGSTCSVGQITIDKCTGTRRNDSGLAVTVAPSATLTGEPVLLPGDASYSRLPAGITAPFDSIACPHHGGAMRGAATPACPGRPHSRLAYSYGLGNGYGHPLHATRVAHDSAAWFDPTIAPNPTPRVRETKDRASATGLGHIAVGWSIWSRPPSISCTGTCDLPIQQT